MTRSSGIAIEAGVALCLALLRAAMRFADGLPPIARPRSATAVPPDAAPFPRVARDILGDELGLEQAPRALVSQSLVTDHFLFAVVPENRIVAVSTFAHDRRYSHVSETVKRMDLAVSTDPEAILRRRPDLALVSQWARAEYVDVVRSAVTPVFRMRTSFKGFGEIADGLKTTGSLTGGDAAAEVEIRRL